MKKTQPENNGQVEGKPTKRRKGGAQPGNRNSEKHGFYSQEFRDFEFADLEAITAVGMSEEVRMLRVVMRRLLAYAERAPECSPEEMRRLTQVLECLGRSSTRLAYVLKMNKDLAKEDGGWGAEILQALTEVRIELNLTQEGI